MRERKSFPVQIIIAIVITAIVGIFGGILAYNKGKARGEAETKLEAITTIEEIAKLVEAKNDIERTFEGLRQQTVDGLTQESLSEYLEQLEKLQNNVENEELKIRFGNLHRAFTEFKEVFDDGDAVAIEFEFGQLKETAEAEAGLIYDVFEERLRGVMQKLAE